MTRRRDRTLALLGRLNRLAVEDAARELGALRAEESRLVRDRDALLTQMLEDRTAPDAEGAPYRAAWMRALSAETQRLSAAAVRMRPEIDRATDRVAEAFREAKTSETLRARRRAEADQATAAAERADLDPFLTRFPDAD
ncbi:hypothetical protein [Roseivivax isoporae]|uniref:Flagellar FliJ protein n=1 Tax=Roseivivax isoporae LMG 25204 TaxID=1449351 RepID=X7F811_9RHOB|nr:hypothetical protein [Roseivivax isoporae]ETX28873.1 hypothetical protein RISW2_03960 [Roseivivax isoporae LMG 25204]